VEVSVNLNNLFLLSISNRLTFADYQGFTDFFIRFPLFSANRQCQELKEKFDRKEATEESRSIVGFCALFGKVIKACT